MRKILAILSLGVPFLFRFSYTGTSPGNKMEFKTQSVLTSTASTHNINGEINSSNIEVDQFIKVSDDGFEEIDLDRLEHLVASSNNTHSYTIC